jgi:hypothetical protein
MNSKYFYNSIDIFVNGKPIRQYAHNGQTFIEARHGAEYTIKIRNNSAYRKLAVVSVDGINVINGKAAGASEAGYIINGYSSYEIKGFRVSNDQVNAFKFSTKSRSYAAKSEETKGDTSNCGVIGIKVYGEKQLDFRKLFSNVHSVQWGSLTTDWNPNTQPMTWTTCTNDSNLVATASYSCSNRSDDVSPSNLMRCRSSSQPTVKAMSFDMGTEFSKKEIRDEVKMTNFDIDYNDCMVYEIYYASKDSLISMGVPIKPVTQFTMPKAFPTEFCKPPRY